MAPRLRDKIHLWVVWHRGKKPSDVAEVLGLYRFKDQARTQAERADADGMTPVRDLVIANVLIAGMHGLFDRALTAAAAQPAAGPSR